jgi:4-diphosphocytidyl-2-C-methyl-D-erythritol kinase
VLSSVRRLLMIKSFCKINLSLRVLHKMNNGLHNIQSNVFLLDLYDEINIKKIKKDEDKIVFKGQFKKLVNSYENSVKDTIFLLRKQNIIKKNINYQIVINKKIPVFSGLGGGSSNSAFIIKYFIKDKKKKFKIKEFEEKIGTDLGLFFNKQSLQKSLKKIENYKKKYNFYFLLVYPNLKCSTKEIYSKVNKYSNSSKTNFRKLYSKAQFASLIKKERNDLQNIAIAKYKSIKKIIEFISSQKGCYFSRMTGSGSVCFGMFKSKKTAKFGLKTIKKKFPKYWCVVSKTI